MRSESTRAFGQPRLTKPTLGFCRDMECSGDGRATVKPAAQGARLYPPARRGRWADVARPGRRWRPGPAAGRRIMPFRNCQEAPHVPTDTTRHPTRTVSPRAAAMSAFDLDPRLAADSAFVADGPLSQVRLMDDTRFPWLLLVPRVPGAVEWI